MPRLKRCDLLCRGSLKIHREPDGPNEESDDASRDVLGDLTAFFGWEFLDPLRVRLRLGIDCCAIEISIVRLNTAYVLKEAFGQLWDYEREGWARRFFENWRSSLKWQRLKPFEKFAEMIDRHWDGIAAYCKPENKVSLGFVEGLNNKIRVIQRRAYGLRDQEYLRLKVLTCMLPAL